MSKVGHKLRQKQEVPRAPHLNRSHQHLRSPRITAVQETVASEESGKGQEKVWVGVTEQAQLCKALKEQHRVKPSSPPSRKTPCKASRKPRVCQLSN